MPRQRYTLAQLKARLRERAGNNSRFWTDPELRDALNEAISVWQALTGEWTTRVRIPALSDSPSFFPVPKQIVSLTRVGLTSVSEAENPLGGSIMFSFPAIESWQDASTIHSSWLVPIQMYFMATGGVGPYQVTWEFNDGTASVTGNPVEHSFQPPAGADVFTLNTPIPRTVTATVLDAAGDTFAIQRNIYLIDPLPTEYDYPATPHDLRLNNFPVVGWHWGDMVVSAEVRYDDAGHGSPPGAPTSIASATDWYGIKNPGLTPQPGLWGTRYPFKIEWDFKPNPAYKDGPFPPVQHVQIRDDCAPENILLDLTVGGGEGLRVSRVIGTYAGWMAGNNKYLGEFGGDYQTETPTGGQYNCPSPGSGLTYMRVFVPEQWLIDNPAIYSDGSDWVWWSNYTLSVTDGTGRKVTRVIPYRILLTSGV